MHPNQMKNQMKQIFTALCLLIFTVSYSQDSLPELNLDSVVITGVRADTKTPISQKIVSKSDIYLTYQGEEVPIILDKTPSITSATDGGHSQGYSYFWLRGIDQTRINVTLDGVPLNEPEDQGVYTSNYYGFINGIKSLQIQRGVGTSTNGVSSFGGSINFESETGTQKKTEIQLGVGSYRTLRGTVTYGSGLTKNKFAFFGTGSAYTTNGYRYHSGGMGSSLFLSGGYYGNKDIVKLTGFIGLSKNQMAYFGETEESIKQDRRNNSNGDGDDDKFRQILIKLQYSRVLTKNTTLTTSIFYNRLDGRYFMDFWLPYRLKLQSNFYGVISNLNYTIKNIKFNLGISGNLYTRKHIGLFDNTTANYVNVGYKNEFSTFGKVSYDLNRVTLFLDVQYRFATFNYKDLNKFVLFPKRKYSLLSPKIGTVIRIKDGFNTYISLGLSQREPTRSNMFEGTDSLTVFNDLKKESVVDLEFGFNVNKKGVTLQANYYYMGFDNAIVPNGGIGANTLPKMTNVKKSIRTGIELDFAYQVNKYFSFGNTFNASYNKFTNADGVNKFLLYSPSVVFNQYVKAEYKNVMIMLSGKAQSKSYISFDNTVVTPAFFALNLDASYKIGIVTFMFEANNITNAKYYINGSSYDFGNFFMVNAGPNFYGTVKFNF